MDCRKPLALGLFVLAGSAGCSYNTAAVPAATTSTKVAAVPKSDTLDPNALKRQPKPETFVAFGDFSAREADAATNPAEQEQLRDRARRAYQEALKADPGNVAARKSLASLYVITNDFDRAKEMYTAALQTAPDDAALWFALGMTYARTKDWAPAVEHLVKAAELDPENRSYHRYLGFTLARAGRYDESLATFTRYEGEAKANFYLAQMLEHLDQIDRCKSHLQLALAKDPQFTEAAQMLVRLNGAAAPGAVPAPGQSEVQPASYTEPARLAGEQSPPLLPPPPPPLQPMATTNAAAPADGK
jgi:tetratricopeptide (TPR) repeat protein